MKLLKTIGKVIALPFDLALILGKLLLIPIKLVSVLLHGEFIEWNKKRKFIGNSIKEMFKAFKDNKDYSFLYSVVIVCNIILIMLKQVLNKKVRNATKQEIDGIVFRSKLEAYTYQKLKEAGISAEYEQHRYTLLPKFVYNNSTVRAITYLPDFVGDGFVIECKGFATDSWANREKLFKYYLSLNEPDTKFYLVKNKKQVDELINKLKS